MACLAFPSRLELKSLAVPFKEAPLKKVSFAIDLYDSPVQISPSWDHIGVPSHFHASTTSGSASLMRARILVSVSPLQSPNSAILPLISLEAALPAAFGWLFIFLPIIGDRPHWCLFAGWRRSRLLTRLASRRKFELSAEANPCSEVNRRGRTWPKTFYLLCIMVAHRGFEPLISSLRGTRPWPLDECATREPLDCTLPPFS